MPDWCSYIYSYPAKIRVALYFYMHLHELELISWRFLPPPSSGEEGFPDDLQGADSHRINIIQAG